MHNNMCTCIITILYVAKARELVYKYCACVYFCNIRVRACVCALL